MLIVISIYLEMVSNNSNYSQTKLSLFSEMFTQLLELCWKAHDYQFKVKFFDKSGALVQNMLLSRG